MNSINAHVPLHTITNSITIPTNAVQPFGPAPLYQNNAIVAHRCHYCTWIQPDLLSSATGPVWRTSCPCCHANWPLKSNEPSFVAYFGRRICYQCGTEQFFTGRIGHNRCEQCRVGFRGTEVEFWIARHPRPWLLQGFEDRRVNIDEVYRRWKRHDRKVKARKIRHAVGYEAYYAGAKAANGGMLPANALPRSEFTWDLGRALKSRAGTKGGRHGALLPCMYCGWMCKGKNGQEIHGRSCLMESHNT